MTPINYYLAIIEDKLVILDSLMAHFSSWPHFNLVMMAGPSKHFPKNRKQQRIDLLLCDKGLPGRLGVEMAYPARSYHASKKQVHTSRQLRSVHGKRQSIAG